MGIHLLDRKAFEPMVHCHYVVSLIVGRPPCLLNQLGCPRPLPGEERMPHCLRKLTVLGIPLTGTQVEGGNLLSLHLQQALAQGFSEEGMVAEPAALPIERHDKEVGPFELLQHLLASLLAEDRITEGSRESLQDAGT